MFQVTWIINDVNQQKLDVSCPIKTQIPLCRIILLHHNYFLPICHITGQRLSDSDAASGDEGDEHDSPENIEKTGDILNILFYSTWNLILSVVFPTFFKEKKQKREQVNYLQYKC